MTQPCRVAVYGGSFHPPHLGHVFTCAWALTTGEVDEVLIVPCYRHPFAKTLAPFADRMVMAERAMGWLPGVSVSRVEEELGGESRTLRTLERLRERSPQWSLRLLVGADVLADASKWYGFERVVELAPLLVVGRQGTSPDPGFSPELPDISSTWVRQQLAAGRVDAVRRVVPAAVLAYIQERGLYQGDETTQGKKS